MGVHARFGFRSLGSVTIGNANVQRDAVIPQGLLPTDFNDDFRPDILFQNLTTRETSRSESERMFMAVPVGKIRVAKYVVRPHPLRCQSLAS